MNALARRPGQTLLRHCTSACSEESKHAWIRVGRSRSRAARPRLSPRRYPETLAQSWYDAHHALRRVRAGDEIKWCGRSVFISETLAREPAGIAETQARNWLVRYAHIDLGIIDLTSNRQIRFVSPRSGRHKANNPSRLSPMFPV